MILNRPVSNVNSFLFVIKDKVLDYIIATADGFNSVILESLAQSIDNVKLSKLMNFYF